MSNDIVNDLLSTKIGIIVNLCNDESCIDEGSVQAVFDNKLSLEGVQCNRAGDNLFVVNAVTQDDLFRTAKH